jgi:hypothetical protein
MDDAVLLQPASSQYEVEAQARGRQEIRLQYEVEAQARGRQEIRLLRQVCHGELEVACAVDFHLLSFPSQQDVAVVRTQGGIGAEDASVNEIFCGSGVDQGWDLLAVYNNRQRDVGGSRVVCRGYFYRRRRSSTAGTVVASRPAAEFSGFVLALGQSWCQCRSGQNRHRGSWGSSLGCL